MRPLEDLRIVAVEQYGAGPFGSVHLADLGAEVIKIEDPRVGGDVGRYVPPYAEGEDSLFFETFNRNKRSLSLDLTTDGRPRGLRGPGRASPTSSTPTCAATCRRRSRIRYDDLKHLNPRSSAVSLTGFGMTGPRRAEPGYDYVLQGLAGWMDLTGEPGRTADQVRSVDGRLLAAASSPRSRCSPACTPPAATASGMDCDVSLYDTAVAMLTYPGDLAPQRRLRAGPHPPLGAPVARAVPGVRGQGRLDGRRLRQGEVLAAGWPRSSSHPEWAEPTSPYGRSPSRGEQQRRAAAPARGDLPAEDRRRVARPAVRGVDPVRADQRRRRGAGRGRTPPPATSSSTTEHPRYGTVRQLASPVRVGDERARRTAGRRSATRTSHW